MSRPTALKYMNERHALISTTIVTEKEVNAIGSENMLYWICILLAWPST